MSTKYRNSGDVPLDTIITRLNELSDAVAGGCKSQEREFTMRIPAECDRDADLVIAEAAVRLTKLHAENEALRARVAVQFDALTSIAVALKGAGNLTKEMHDFIVAATDGDSEAILLRKQAEAVEALAKRFQDAADKADRADEDESDTALTLIIAKSVALKEAYQLRQKADEMKKAGGEQ